MAEEVHSGNFRLEQSRRVLRHSLIGQFQLYGGLSIPATKLVDSKLATDLYLPAISPMSLRRVVLPPLATGYNAPHHHHHRESAQNQEGHAAVSTATTKQTPRGRPLLQRTQTSLDAGVDASNSNSLREKLQQRRVRHSLTISSSDIHNDWPTPLANKMRHNPHLDVSPLVTNTALTIPISSNGNHIVNDTSRLVSKDLDELASRKPSAMRPEHRRIQIVYQQDSKATLGGGYGTMPILLPTEDRCWPSATEQSSYLKHLDHQTLSGDEKTKQWLLANPVEHVTGLERERDANRHVMFSEEQEQQQQPVV